VPSFWRLLGMRGVMERQPRNNQEVSARIIPFPQRQEQQIAPQQTRSEPSLVFDLTAVRERRNSPEHMFSKEWLQSEVAKERKKPARYGETPWYHLSGTGFWVQEQVGQLMRNVSTVGREAFPDVLELELSKVTEDVKSFEREYLQQLASLKFNLAWQERDGEMRIVCPDYKGAAKEDQQGVLWESVTSPLEREGAVSKALFGDKEKGIKGVEEKLRDADPGTVAVMVSPPGWSGFSDADGKAIRYPETQVYTIHKKDDGSLQAYTFRYDATIEQNEELQQKLGLEIPESHGQKDRIKKMLGNVAIIQPIDAVRAELAGKPAIRSFEDVVTLMQESVGGREVMYDGDGNQKTFDEVREQLANPEGFAHEHPLTGKLIDRFLDYARWRFQQGGTRAEIEKDLQISLALTPLHLNKLYRDIENLAPDVSQSIGRRLETMSAGDSIRNLEKYIRNGVDYDAAKKDLADRPGCAGGGGSNTYVTSMGVSRKAESGQEWFSCSECGWKADGPIGESACGGCGFTKAQYEEKYGIAC
jgi:hypothetical protein